ncbi:MAG: hypothetical protein KF846_11045 [Cyclobacteriaceae bacterium]|nr:hypothetical protein [Cyclobacteriaceae bacterium]
MERKYVVSQILILILISSFSQSNAQRTGNCQETSWLLWTGNHGSGTISHIELNFGGQYVTFYTNLVCGAENYIWTINGTVSRMTQVPYITMRAQDFIWLPAGGCQEFNSKLKLATPWDDIGTLTVIFTVQSNITSPVITPILISGVEKCYGDGSTKKKDPRIGN